MSLSPGDYFGRVPREREANLAYRARMLAECEASAECRAWVREACARDVLFFVNTFVWTYNPRKIGTETLPFISWGFQDALFKAVLDHVEKQEDLVIEKSRDMGVSWVNLIALDWLALFTAGKKFLCISHTEDAVDKVDEPDSLFWKVQFIHDRLPLWLVEKPVKKKLSFIFPQTGSTMTGTATTERSGVGGRATAIFLDEFSKQRTDFEIESHTADTTGCRIFNGTHYGVGTCFYDLCYNRRIRKLVLHWSQHPEKGRGLYRVDPVRGVPEILDESYPFDAKYEFDRSGRPTGGPFPGLRSPWYDDEVRRRTSKEGGAGLRNIAMHLDIDPQGSTSQFFVDMIPELVREFARPPLWRGNLRFDTDSGEPDRLMEERTGPLQMWLNFLPDGGIPAGRYAVGVDTSAGQGATNSCCTIVNIDTGEKVVELATPWIQPRDFAAYVVALARLFRSPGGDPAFMAWETNGPGTAFGIRVGELGFVNCYYRSTDQVGWYPSDEAMRVLLEDYREALLKRQFVNRSEEALLECLNFQYVEAGKVKHSGYASKNDPSGAGYNHGDRVIADALALLAARERGGQVRRGGPSQPEVKEGTLAWRMERARKLEDAEGLW